MTDTLSYWDASAAVLKILPAWEPLENLVQVKVLISETWDGVWEVVFLLSSQGGSRGWSEDTVGYKVLEHSVLYSKVSENGVPKRRTHRGPQRVQRAPLIYSAISPATYIVHRSSHHFCVTHSE